MTATTRDKDKDKDKDKEGTPLRNLYQRLAAVQAEIEAVPKTGRNVAFSYAYIEQGLVMAALRPKLAAHGVVLVPRIRGSVQTVGTTQKGGQQITERVSVEFTLVNADDPTDTLVVPWLAEGQDSTDKAINKAIVAAQKYMLMKLFLISDADDPDGGGEETAKPASHRSGEQTAAPNGQRRQPMPAVARKEVDPRRPALDRAAEEMATEAEAETEDALPGQGRPPKTASVDGIRRNELFTSIQALVGAGVKLDTGERWKELARAHEMIEPARSADMTVGWLEELYRRMRERQSQPQSQTEQPKREQAKRERTLAGWIAAAPDEATLTQLRSDVMGALKAGSLTDKAAEALLEAVAARAAEIDLYPQATDGASASDRADAEAEEVILEATVSG